VTRAPRLALLLVPLGLLAGCAGQARDFIGPRSAITRPQLIRYGFSLPQIACVGERLGEVLTPRQLRLFTRAAGAATRPFFDPDRFSSRDFILVARSMPDGRIGVEVARALDACQVRSGPEIAAVPAPPTPAEDAPRSPTWLNLGAAGSGQSIAVDASSLEQDETSRTAWFRMVDPAPGGPSLHSYRLRIDCGARTLQPLGHRRHNATGAVVESRDIPAGEEAPTAVVGGTVTEIAYLSLCT